MATSQKTVVKKSTREPAKLAIINLANKHRPNVLDDLVGQDHIAAELIGMFANRRIPATVLLNGRSGCGKTTIARMIARYLLCLSPDKKTHAPCGECASCRYGIDHPDVSELNMAETRGIDDVRALIQSSKSMPTLGDNRLFIIDEIHAATPQALQALLKPLEEPPSRTLWILATTNPEKLPNTILGRCHKLNVNPIEPKDMSRRLYSIARSEKIDIKAVPEGPEMVKLITSLSNGQMRDAVGLLEKALALIASGRDLGKDKLLSEILKTPDSDLDKDSAVLIASLLSNDLKSMLKTVRCTQSVRGLISKCRWLLQHLLDSAVGIAKYTPLNGKMFSTEARRRSITVKLTTVVQLQYLILDIESRLNTMPVDEGVVMLSMLGNYMNQNRSST